MSIIVAEYLTYLTDDESEEEEAPPPKKAAPAKPTAKAAPAKEESEEDDGVYLWYNTQSHSFRLIFLYSAQMMSI